MKKELNRPIDLSKVIGYLEELIYKDEITEVLRILDNLPAEYREKTPKELIFLKKKVAAMTMTPFKYTLGDLDKPEHPDTAVQVLEHTLRGKLIQEQVRELNNNGIEPYIVDHGPGTYWLPIGLAQMGYKFTYTPLYLKHSSFIEAKPAFSDQLRPPLNCPVDKVPEGTIFVATETIEHHFETHEITANHARFALNADFVHVSTPRFCFDSNFPHWTDKKELGHVKTYSPPELFSEVAFKLFPEYHWELIDSEIMHMVGRRKMDIEI